LRESEYFALGKFSDSKGFTITIPDLDLVKISPQCGNKNFYYCPRTCW